MVPHMLALLLQQIGKDQNPEVLLTCDAVNAASIRVMEKNGARFESELFDEVSGKMILRYRIIIP